MSDVRPTKSTMSIHNAYYTQTTDNLLINMDVSSIQPNVNLDTPFFYDLTLIVWEGV